MSPENTEHEETPELIGASFPLATPLSFGVAREPQTSDEEADDDAAE